MTDKPDNDDYDLERLFRFINGVMLNRPSDDPGHLASQKRCRERQGITDQAITEDMLAAAYALDDALHGVDLCKKYKLHLQPSKAVRRTTLNHPVTAVALAKLNGEITHKQACEEIAKLEEVGIKEAEKILSEVSKGKQPTLDTFKGIFKHAGWDEYKAAPQLTNEQKAAEILKDTSLQPFERIKRIQETFGYDRRQALDYIAKNKT